MRTLRSLPLEEKERLKIAEEALNVYAPLAHRMGVMKVKGELEDLAFKILHPEMFQVRKASLLHSPLSKSKDTNKLCYCSVTNAYTSQFSSNAIFTDLHILNEHFSTPYFMYHRYPENFVRIFRYRTRRPLKLQQTKLTTKRWKPFN